MPFQFDFIGIESGNLGNRVGRFVNYIDVSGVAGRHPQFSSRSIVGQMVEDNNAIGAGQGDRLDLVIGNDGVRV